MKRALWQARRLEGQLSHLHQDYYDCLFRPPPNGFGFKRRCLQLSQKSSDHQHQDAEPGAAALEEVGE